MGSILTVAALLTASIGLLAGVIISMLAKEELHQGRKIFKWSRCFAFALSVLASLWILGTPLMAFFAGIAGFLFVWLFPKAPEFARISVLLILASLAIPESMFPYALSGVFLYGLFASTSLTEHKAWREIGASMIVLVILSVVFGLLL